MPRERPGGRFRKIWDCRMTGRSGIAIAGCEPGCGKTVVATGLAGTLLEEGFQFRALKPVCLCRRQDAESELRFISTISHTPLAYPVQYVNGQQGLGRFAWDEAVRAIASGVEPVIVELPGSCASPLCRDGSGANWRDSADLAGELGLPAILVAREGPSAVEKLVVNAAYLASRHVQVIGLVTCEVSQPAAPGRAGAWSAGSGPDTGAPGWSLRPEAVALALQERTGVPYLGCLKFSQSISVPKVNQGNLIKTTSGCLDLLPIIKTLNLRISV